MLKNIIHHELIAVTRDARLKEIIQLMEDRNVGSVLVLENEKPIGIITDRDIVLRCFQDSVKFDQCTAADLMTESVKSVKTTDGVYKCIQTMEQLKVRRLPVVDEDGRATGIISFDDLISFLADEFALLARIPAAFLKHKKAA
jgi:CBS domain-containing protein